MLLFCREDLSAISRKSVASPLLCRHASSLRWLGQALGSGRPPTQIRLHLVPTSSNVFRYGIIRCTCCSHRGLRHCSRKANRAPNGVICAPFSPLRQWEVRYSNSRQRPYFYNESQSLSIWEPPTSLSEDDIVNLPGAREHLHRKPDPDTVQASHLLIKHRDSRRPASWKEVRSLPPYCTGILLLYICTTLTARGDDARPAAHDHAHKGRSHLRAQTAPVPPPLSAFVRSPYRVRKDRIHRVALLVPLARRRPRPFQARTDAEAFRGHDVRTRSGTDERYRRDRLRGTPHPQDGLIPENETRRACMQPSTACRWNGPPKARSPWRTR